MSNHLSPSAESLAREFAEGRVRPATTTEVLSLGVLSRTHFYAAIKDGTIPTVRVGKRHLIPADEVRRLLGLPLAEGVVR